MVRSLRSLVSASGLCLVLTSSLHAHAGDNPERPGGAVYPLTVVGSMALGPAGGEGRWGLAFERHPGRPRDDERVRTLGFGIGLAGGVASIGASMDGTSPTSSSRTGAWIAPVLRPGFFFATKRELWVSGCLGVGLAPIVDVLGGGSARLTLSEQPGFLISVARFAFGMSMMLDETVAAPRAARRARLRRRRRRAPRRDLVSA